MARSNIANGSNYFDLVFQVVSSDANQYTLRAVVYLTTLTLSDSVNGFNVSENGYGRSGSYPFSGAYNAAPIWHQDITFSRPGAGSAGTVVSVYAEITGVEYWGVTLSAREFFTVPARDAFPPSPPTIDVADITATSARIWTAVAGAENGATTQHVNYRVVRTWDGLHMGDRQGGYNPGVVFDNLFPGTTFTATGQAYNAAGYGGWSAPVQFTTSSAAPGSPSVAASAVTATSVLGSISTTPPDNGAAIDHYLYRVFNAQGQQVAEVTGPPSGATVSGLTRATPYTLVAYAHNSVGYGPASAAVAFTTLPSIPGAPTITGVTSITPSSATVSWSPPADTGGQAITAYDVEYSTNDFATFITQATGTLTNLTPGTAYKVRVRAKNASGNGPYSTPVAFTTQSGMKVYTGSAWVDAPVYAWTGSAWVACEVRIWNGTAWVPTG